MTNFSPLVRVLVPTLAALAVAVAGLNLGFWQLRRASEKLGLEQQRRAVLEAAPARLPPPPLSAETLRAMEGRKVNVSGCLLTGQSVFVDNRSQKGVAGFHLLTPIRIESSSGPPGTCDREPAESTHLLILRGWVPRDPRERTRLPPVAMIEGPVEVIGIVQRELPRSFDLGATMVPAAEERIWQNPTLGDFATRTGLEMLPIVLRQTSVAIGGNGPFEDGLGRDWPAPGDEVDKHRGYAFQWFSLAATAAGLWVWFVVLNPWRTRRRSRNGNQAR